jgi:crossover junction endodeoxyribonuclease RuvC
MGYGLIEVGPDEMGLVCCDCLTCSPKSPIGERLSYLYNTLTELITRYRPEAMAVEQPFMAKNARAALAIGRAQAIAILAAANLGIPSYEYTPAQVKQQVAGHGASSKEQVAEMVRIQLRLTEAPQPDDATDALAVAICHLREIHLTGLLARAERE